MKNEKKRTKKKEKRNSPHISTPDADRDVAEVTELAPPVPPMFVSEGPDTPSVDIFRGRSTSSLFPVFASEAEVEAGADVAASEPGMGISRLPLAL